MPKKLPIISGKKLISFLGEMGYRVVRQRGSHVRLEKPTEAGLHKITVPNHDPIAKGTLKRHSYKGFCLESNAKGKTHRPFMIQHLFSLETICLKNYPFTFIFSKKSGEENISL